MSEIQNILKKLEGTLVHDILVEVEKDYLRIAAQQKEWYDKTKFLCPDGCGKCCINFEPDLTEPEVLYMAAWLIENQSEKAESISNGKFPFSNGKTCPLYNAEDKYHCSIYGGRAFICRLFGASSAYSKDTVLLRDILPETINKLYWIIAMNGNDNPNGSPNAPVAA